LEWEIWRKVLRVINGKTAFKAKIELKYGILALDAFRQFGYNFPFHRTDMAVPA
jgi:hypothetical protein